MFETFDHTADIGLRLEADSLETLLAEAGRGFLSVVCANPETVRGVHSRTMELSFDREELDDLLFDWLAELLYAFDAEHFLAAEFDIAIDGDTMHATVRGEPIDDSRHELDMDVKAITYHGLFVEQRDGLWRAEVILDL